MLSVSAHKIGTAEVENICKIIIGSKAFTLGDALNILERKGKINKYLKAGFDKLYPYTNDADGIRRAIMEEAD